MSAGTSVSATRGGLASQKVGMIAVGKAPVIFICDIHEALDLINSTGRKSILPSRLPKVPLGPVERDIDVAEIFKFRAQHSDSAIAPEIVLLRTHY